MLAVMFEHFVSAQDRVYADVLSELRAGQKASHWMWFIFPQLAALGRSDTARRFGIADLAEAQLRVARRTRSSAPPMISSSAHR